MVFIFPLYTNISTILILITFNCVGLAFYVTAKSYLLLTFVGSLGLCYIVNCIYRGDYDADDIDGNNLVDIVVAVALGMYLIVMLSLFPIFVFKMIPL